MRFWLGLAILALAGIVLVLMDDPGATLGMQKSELARLAMSSALLIVIGGGVLLAYRGRAGDAVRHAAGWLGFALVLLVLYSYRMEFAALGDRVLGELVPGMPAISTVARPDGGSAREVTIRATANGHFNVRAQINGKTIGMVADTGASVVTLTYDDALAVGIDPERLFFNVPVSTANGTTEAAPVRLDEVSVGGVAVNNLRGLVARPDSLFSSLLGMNYLRAVGGFEIRGDALVIRQ